MKPAMPGTYGPGGDDSVYEETAPVSRAKSASDPILPSPAGICRVTG
ncbi:hypothetical protein GCM10010436_38260 [Paractinoplanes durhamensis]